MSITLSGLFVYPVKSLAGFSVQHCELTARGLKYDRRWMVVKPDGSFMTQRKFPKMALLSTEIQQSKTLVITAPKMGSLSVPLAPEEGWHESQNDGQKCEKMVEVWGDRCVAWSMGKQAQEWLSDVLETPCELVYMPDESDRPVDHGKLGNDKQVSFADAYPYLLISQASLDDLNHRLETPILMNQFRPNLVVQGCGPFDEDTWKSIQIGKVSFVVDKACSRCIVTTINQSTGERGVEPLKTLATYRRWDGQIWFGQNLIHEDLGVVSVGDRIHIRSHRA
ncbi:MAG: MOSC N-terminal beta barrel domain-containing protein [Leptolyngbyaceae bacterium]|nr:MOSC N-terminal beta barrel domain-containing protein [Leptolyngbyaceae bacterium]